VDASRFARILYKRRMASGGINLDFGPGKREQEILEDGEYRPRPARESSGQKSVTGGASTKADAPEEASEQKDDKFEESQGDSTKKDFKS